MRLPPSAKHAIAAARWWRPTPDGPHAAVYRDIAAKVWAQVNSGRGATRQAPKIVIEA